MSHEFNLYGVFIHGALAAAMVAAVLHQLVRWALGRAGLYAYVWHPGLSDAAIFLCLWAAVVALWP